jgi:hypothetical protein
MHTWAALVTRVDMLAAKSKPTEGKRKPTEVKRKLNTAEVKKLWKKVDPKNLLGQEWLLANPGPTSAVLWVVVWALKFALQVLQDSDSAISKSNFFKRKVILDFIKSYRDDIVKDIKSLVPPAVHLLFDNFADLQQETEPFIELVQTKVDKFTDIKSFILILQTLRGDLNELFRLYEGDFVSTQLPASLKNMLEQLLPGKQISFNCPADHLNPCMSFFRSE